MFEENGHAVLHLDNVGDLNRLTFCAWDLEDLLELQVFLAVLAKRLLLEKLDEVKPQKVLIDLSREALDHIILGEGISCIWKEERFSLFRIEILK